MTRNAVLDDMVKILRDQHARKLDIVVPATKIRAKDGLLVISGVEAELTEDGVTTVDGRYQPTKVCDSGIAEKLRIPGSYLTRLREEGRTDLYDGNVTGLLQGKQVRRAGGEVEVIHPADGRSFLARLFRDENGGVGVARALLSNKWGGMDNLDVLMAGVEGINASGVHTEVTDAYLTDRRMYIDFFAPAVTAMAPVLLGGYRNPFDNEGVTRNHPRNDVEYWRGVAAREGLGYEPGTEPIVFAGFRLSNSEVGEGMASVTPLIKIKICRNGLVVTDDTIAHRHIGSRLDDGIVNWSRDTHKAQLNLIKAKARDAVVKFLNPEYLQDKINAIEEKAGKPVAKAADTIKKLGKQLGYTQDEQDGILEHFVMGGQLTAGGIVNAVTSFSQTIGDADRANDLDGSALQVLKLV